MDIIDGKIVWDDDEDPLEELSVDLGYTSFNDLWREIVDLDETHKIYLEEED